MAARAQDLSDYSMLTALFFECDIPFKGFFLWRFIYTKHILHGKKNMHSEILNQTHVNTDSCTLRPALLYCNDACLFFFFTLLISAFCGCLTFKFILHKPWHSLHTSLFVLNHENHDVFFLHSLAFPSLWMSLISVHFCIPLLIPLWSSTSYC